MASLLLLAAVGGAAAQDLGSASGPTESEGERPSEARARFEEGVRALREGAYEEALAAFEASYRLDPRPIVLYDIGMCHWELHELPAAWDALSGYFRDAGDDVPAEILAEADRILAEIRAATFSLRVEVGEPGAIVYVDGVDVGGAPFVELPVVAPGTHVVTAREEGLGEAQATVSAQGGERVTVTLGFAAPIVPVAAGTGTEDPGERPPGRVGEGPTVAAAGGAILENEWFWTNVGIAAASSLAAVVTGSLGLTWRDDYVSGGARDAALRATVVELGVATDVLLGVAAAGALGALIVYLASGEEQAEAEDGAGVSLLPGRLVLTW